VFGAGFRFCVFAQWRLQKVVSASWPSSALDVGQHRGIAPQQPILAQ
jgi:hypothetical protein